MENLWPTSLLDESNEGTSNEIVLSLETQVRGVADRTGGLVGGFVKERSFVGPSKTWSFELFSAHLPDRATPLFVVRSEDGDFPVVIERFDPAPERFMRVSDCVQFSTALKELLSAPHSRNIVNILASEAKKAGVRTNFPSNGMPPPIERTLLIGQATQFESQKICHVVLLDVAGFIDANDLEKLLKDPDTEGSSVQSFSGRFVVTVKFQSPVKFTLNANELKMLQAQVSQAQVSN